MSDETPSKDIASDPGNAAPDELGSRARETGSDAIDTAQKVDSVRGVWREKEDAEVRHALSTLSGIQNLEERVAILNEAHSRRITPEQAKGADGLFRLTPWLGVLVFLLFLGGQLALGFVGGILIAIRFTLQGGDVTDAQAVEAAIGEFAGVLGMVCSLVAGLAVVAWIRAMRARPGGEQLEGAIGWVRRPARTLAQGVVVGAVIASAYLLSVALGVRPDAEFQPGPVVVMVSSGGWQRGLWALFAIGVAPMIEEFVFRGVLYAAFSKLAPVLACALTSLLFVGIHLTEIGGFWAAAVPIAGLSIAAFVARRASGSIAMPIAMHAGYNLIIVIGVYLGS